MSRTLAIAIVVAALVGAGAGFAGGYFSRSPPAPQAREFYILSVVLGFNDSYTPGVPHDGFSPDQITVNRGDSVTIHFYNTEDEAERHSFTMAAPYAMDHDLNWQENKSFTFTASTAGAFQYWCKYHLPSMVGYLLVLG